MINNDDFYFNGFDTEKCTDCGLCFEECSVLNLDNITAKEDIISLINNDYKNSLAFKYCTTCNSCNITCPYDADPYELILENFYIAGQKNGIPSLAKLVFPNKEGNIWSLTKHLMPEDEVKLLEEWKENVYKKQDEIILTGFYSNIMPYVAKTGLYGDLHDKIVGYEGLFGCGGDSYKLGQLKMTYQIGKRVQKFFKDIGVKKVYTFMEAETAMLKEVLPERFGIEFDFEVKPVDSLLYDRIKSGEIVITNKLNKKVTLHDNCCSRYLNSVPQKESREILEQLGCETVEMKHTKKDALCCGWAATIPTLYREKYSLIETFLYLLESLNIRLKEAEETGAEILVTTCHACTIFLAMIKELKNSKIEIYTIQEMIQLGVGEIPLHRHSDRAWDILAISLNLAYKYFTNSQFRENFIPEDVELELSEMPDASEEDINRVKSIRKLLTGKFVQNSVTGKILASTIDGITNHYLKKIDKDKRRKK